MATTVKMTLRLDPSLYEAIRQKAERRRVPISTLITLALVDTFDPDEPRAVSTTKVADKPAKPMTRTQKRQLLRELHLDSNRRLDKLCKKTDVPNGAGGVTDVNPDHVTPFDQKCMQEQYPAEYAQWQSVNERIKQLDAELKQEMGL